MSITRHWFLFLLLLVSPLQAAELRVAVAANFYGTLQKMAPAFERTSGHQLQLSTGSSGQFYNQIRQGAPFDIFLSADRELPAKLEQEGLADGRFTYAIGRLVLWSPQAGAVDSEGTVLAQGRYRHLAIASPKTAPYGLAAQQVLENLDLWERLTAEKRLVTGENITHTLQFVQSGNAQLGFVALSQVIGADGTPTGSWWFPPQSLYDPIAQDAVALKRSGEPEAARAFLDWLRHDAAAQAAIREAGYTLP